MKLLFTDTETGGLKPELGHSLLTLHAKVVDIDLNIIDQVSLAIKHETYKVTAEALRINKINLLSHDSIALPIPSCQTILDNFLLTHGHKERLIFVAHNAPFDKGMIASTFALNVWDQMVSYHQLDSVGLGVFQKLLKHLLERQSLSLGGYADALGVEKGQAHNAEGDVVTMLNIVRKLVELYGGALPKKN